MKSTLSCIVFLIILAEAPACFAATATTTDVNTATFQEICSMGLTSTATIALSITAPVTTGGYPQGGTDNTKYLLFTTLNNNNAKRTLNARISANVPAGLALRLTGVLASGGYGASTGQITLTTTDQAIVNNIGSGATGTGLTNGINLQYALVVTNPSLLVITGATIFTITFTMTEDS